MRPLVVASLFLGQSSLTTTAGASVNFVALPGIHADGQERPYGRLADSGRSVALSNRQQKSEQAEPPPRSGRSPRCRWTKAGGASCPWQHPMNLFAAFGINLRRRGVDAS